MSTNDFNTILNQQALLYGNELGRVLSQLGFLKEPKVEVLPLSRSLSLNSDFVASISFVGMVTGEFILTLSRAQAKTVFPDTTTDSEIRDSLTESLNMAAGSRIRDLSQIFQKLTITPPRFVSGELVYPSVKNIPIQIKAGETVIQAYLYIDQMRLDIAESYKQIIVDLKSTNEDLSKANLKLKDQQTQLVHSEKMASLGMMAAGVAHEINNPLAFVVSNTEVLNTYVDAMRTLLIGYDQLLQLLTHGKAGEAKSELAKINEIKKKEDVTFILEDTRKLLAESKFGLERIRAIVNGLKRFSRVNDSGIKTVQVNEELGNTLMLLQNELKYKCKIETDFKAQKPVECMPGEMSQVFVNLIINAAQAIKRSDGLIKILTVDGNETIKISIEDNGEGISPENLTKIFSPFFTTKPVGEGTGLGLAITQGIIQKHNGTISCDSTVGKGTTFMIELPYICKIQASENKDPTTSISSSAA